MKTTVASSVTRRMTSMKTQYKLTTSNKSVCWCIRNVHRIFGVLFIPIEEDEMHYVYTVQCAKVANDNKWIQYPYKHGLRVTSKLLEFMLTDYTEQDCINFYVRVPQAIGKHFFIEHPHKGVRSHKICHDLVRLASAHIERST